jgi:hypothetical protein
MTLSREERSLWEAVAAGVVLKYPTNQTVEDAAFAAGRYADAMIVELRKRTEAAA